MFNKKRKKNEHGLCRIESGDEVLNSGRPVDVVNSIEETTSVQHHGASRCGPPEHLTSSTNEERRYVCSIQTRRCNHRAAGESSSSDRCQLGAGTFGSCIRATSSIDLATQFLDGDKSNPIARNDAFMGEKPSNPVESSHKGEGYTAEWLKGYWGYRPCQAREKTKNFLAVSGFPTKTESALHDVPTQDPAMNVSTELSQLKDYENFQSNWIENSQVATSKVDSTSNISVLSGDINADNFKFPDLFDIAVSNVMPTEGNTLVELIPQIDAVSIKEEVISLEPVEKPNEVRNSIEPSGSGNASTLPPIQQSQDVDFEDNAVFVSIEEWTEKQQKESLLEELERYLKGDENPQMNNLIESIMFDGPTEGELADIDTVCDSSCHSLNELRQQMEAGLVDLPVWATLAQPVTVHDTIENRAILFLGCVNTIDRARSTFLERNYQETGYHLGKVPFLVHSILETVGVANQTEIPWTMLPMDAKSLIVTFRRIDYVINEWPERIRLNWSNAGRALPMNDTFYNTLRNMWMCRSDKTAKLGFSNPGTLSEVYRDFLMFRYIQPNGDVKVKSSQLQKARLYQMSMTYLERGFWFKCKKWHASLPHPIKTPRHPYSLLEAPGVVAKILMAAGLSDSLHLLKENIPMSVYEWDAAKQRIWSLIEKPKEILGFEWDDDEGGELPYLPYHFNEAQNYFHTINECMMRRSKHKFFGPTRIANNLKHNRVIHLADSEYNVGMLYAGAMELLNDLVKMKRESEASIFTLQGCPEVIIRILEAVGVGERPILSVPKEQIPDSYDEVIKLGHHIFHIIENAPLQAGIRFETKFASGAGKLPIAFATEQSIVGATLRFPYPRKTVANDRHISGVRAKCSLCYNDSDMCDTCREMIVNTSIEPRHSVMVQYKRTRCCEEHGPSHRMDPVSLGASNKDTKVEEIDELFQQVDKCDPCVPHFLGMSCERCDTVQEKAEISQTPESFQVKAFIGKTSIKMTLCTVCGRFSDETDLRITEKFTILKRIPFCKGKCISKRKQPDDDPETPPLVIDESDDEDNPQKKMKDGHSILACSLVGCCIRRNSIDD